jgi:hypothetical protein
MFDRHESLVEALTERIFAKRYVHQKIARRRSSKTDGVLQAALRRASHAPMMFTLNDDGAIDGVSLEKHNETGPL